MLTFADWFNGRFWNEWVIARRNKPSEVEAKTSIFKVHLEPEFGHVPLDAIDVPMISRFRAKLIKAGKSDKRINNILAVLSKALNYAEQARVIARAPYVGLLKVERPEIVAWSVEEYATLLAAAKALDPMWYAACCLAGEAGLRVGEIRALDWKRDVDLVARTITVNKQTRRGEMTSPKGRTRRTVPMTETLLAALKALETIRTGFVIRNLDGTGMTDNETKYHCYRICRAAGLPERGWHNMPDTQKIVLRRGVRRGPSPDRGSARGAFRSGEGGANEDEGGRGQGPGAHPGHGDGWSLSLWLTA